jgi:DNA polymerase-3 subunit alpha
MYVPLHGHSHYSLLDGLSQGWQIAARVRKLGLKACALTDHGSVSGVPSFLKAMAGACKHCGYQPNQHADGGKGGCTVRGVTCPGYEKDPIKPIMGEEFYVCQKDATQKDADNRYLSHLVVLAKNRDGWRNLIRASSASNLPEHFYYKPRLDLERLASFAGGQWVVFSGHPGSDLANVCFLDAKAAYGARSYEDAKRFTKPWPDLKKDVLALATKYRDLFGRENFFLEIQLVDAVNLPAAQIIAKTLRWVSKQLGIPCVATPDFHYAAPEDAADQRVLLCSSADTTLPEAERKLAAGGEFGLDGFFRSNRYHILSVEDMAALHEPDELANTLRIADMVEPFDIFGKPKLPQFSCPGGMAADEYVKQLCREGWQKKVVGKVPKSEQGRYGDRVKLEMDVLFRAGLSPYFLIVQDFNRYAQEKLKCKKARGRGSAAGCLVAYLLDIHDTDPIKYDLDFERFYNDGRNTADRVSLPDIDCDFPVTKRGKIIEYIRDKYGKSRVAQMCTFARMQGRGALTDVLRAHEWGSFEQRKEITAHIPDESAIADELQEMREDTGEASILKWTLENEGDALKEHCVLKEDGTLEGPMSRYFAQAIRLEGTKRSQGKHAAGIVISPVDLADECPMLYDKNSDLPVIAIEMADAEAMGWTKMDILGVAAYDKIGGWSNTMRTGRVGLE